ncbi:MAG: hypothetical protein EOO70_01330 [Myxococcaceae bacterium]|nr:MAG: hypothetical protein EOO70_01330 [Myxococcaceae bacterium]
MRQAAPLQHGPERGFVITGIRRGLLRVDGGLAHDAQAADARPGAVDGGTPLTVAQAAVGAFNALLQHLLHHPGL